MKKRNLLLIVSALVLLLVSAVSAGAVEGLIVDRQGLPLEGYSNVYIIDGKPQPVYNLSEHRWYDVFIVGASENGTPLCNVVPSDTFGEHRGDDRKEKPFRCFSGTTLVLMADGSTKIIKDIGIGEKVMGYDFAAGRFTSCEVVDNYATVQNDYYILNGGLKVTAGHPFYARNFGPTPASLKPESVKTVMTQELKPYATLYGFNPARDSRLEKLTLNSIIHVSEPGTFYDLQVDGTRNFFVSPDGTLFVAGAVKIK
jgi:hypothetical protein